MAATTTPQQSGRRKIKNNLILNIFPENPLNALTNGEMLPIILFGVLVGFILIKLNEFKKYFW